MMARRQGLDSLRSTLLWAARGECVVEPTALPIGAGLFNDDTLIEAFVQRMLDNVHPMYRAAATYASVFYMGRSKEVASVLAERVVLAEEEPLVLLASRDVLSLWADIKNNGECKRCGATVGLPSIQKPLDWTPERVLSNSV
jgi:hypothetical protein